MTLLPYLFRNKVIRFKYLIIIFSVSRDSVVRRQGFAIPAVLLLGFLIRFIKISPKPQDYRLFLPAGKVQKLIIDNKNRQIKKIESPLSCQFIYYTTQKNEKTLYCSFSTLVVWINRGVLTLLPYFFRNKVIRFKYLIIIFSVSRDFPSAGICNPCRFIIDGTPINGFTCN